MLSVLNVVTLDEKDGRLIKLLDKADPNDPPATTASPLPPWATARSTPTTVACSAPASSRTA